MALFQELSIISRLVGLITCSALALLIFSQLWNDARGRLFGVLMLDITAVERMFKVSFGEYFSRSIDALAPFVDDGLVEITPGAIRILGAGRLLLRNIAMCFDAYLDSMTSGKPIFSRTV